MSIIKDDYKKIRDNYGEHLKALSGKNILVTGSTGMITSYLCGFLLSIAEEFNAKIYLQCRNQEKGRKIYEEYVERPCLQIVNFDISKRIPDINWDYIIHAASPADTKSFLEHPVDVISPNVIGTWNLLNYAKEHFVKKFVLLSSNSIYGEGGVNVSELSENDYGIVDPLGERSCYVESKKMAEQMCQAFLRQYEVPSSIVRICHTYGPTIDLKNDYRIISIVIKQILADEDITIYRDPYSFVQYTYLADITAAILLVLLEGNVGEAYNAGGDEVVFMDDVIAWMVNSDDRIKAKLIEKEIDDKYRFSKGKGINFLKINNDKLKKLGWKQMFSNEEGFKRTVASYLAGKSNYDIGDVVFEK